MTVPTDALAAREMENTLALWAAGIDAAHEGWFVREDDLAWFWSALPIAFLNEVVPYGPNVPIALLERAVAALRATGDPFIARIRAGIDDGLVPDLERLGLREDPSEAMPGMAFHPIDAARLEAAPMPDGLDVRVVEDLAGLADHQAVIAEGFGMPLDIARRLMPPSTLEQAPLTILVGYVGGVPATTAMGWTEGDTVGVYNVATRDAFRRRGLGAAVTRRIVLDGVARGAAVGILQSSPMGEAVYRIIGFREVVGYRVFMVSG